MIKYHGLPISGQLVQSTEFSKNKHVLISFANPKVLEYVADSCDSFCLDNGAFTMWRKGVEPNWDDFVSWVEKWSKHPNYDFAFCPDIIGGSKEENEELMCRYMSKIKNAVPIYHLHEPLEWAELICKHSDRMAIGSSGEWPTPGAAKWWQRMDEVLNVCCDSEGCPLSKIHGLRMLNPKIFTRLPLSSADSANAAINAGSKNRFKSMYPEQAHLRATIIASNVEMSNGAATWQGI